MKTLNSLSALLLAIIVPFMRKNPLPDTTEQPDYLSIITGKLISVYLTAAELLLIIYK